MVSLQCVVSVSLRARLPFVDKHADPPKVGVGLSQVRFLVFVPFPHVNEQDENIVQFPQLPFSIRTGANDSYVSYS